MRWVEIRSRLLFGAIAVALVATGCSNSSNSGASVDADYYAVSCDDSATILVDADSFPDPAIAEHKTCALQDDDNEASDTIAASTSTPAPRSPTTTSAPPSTVPSTTTTEAPLQALTVDIGFRPVQGSFARFTSLGLLISNPNASMGAYGTQVVINLLDANGTILDTGTVDIPYVPAGETVPAAPLIIAYDIDAEPVDADVFVTTNLKTERGWSGVEFTIYEGIELEVTEAGVSPARYGDGVDLSFNVTNPTDRLIDGYPTWDCVFVEDGQIVGGETSSIVDPISPGATVRVDSSNQIDYRSIDEVICRSYA